jgi:uncharacterized protein (DUF362 family)
MLAGALASSCHGAGDDVQGAQGGERKAPGPGGGGGGAPGGGPARGPGERNVPDRVAHLRESARPPVRVSKEDTLSGIRQVKAAGPEMAVVEGKAGARMTRLAVKALGGIERFVQRGDVVVLTPNFALARPEGTGVSTSIEIVREVIGMCREAGAGEIICLDHTYMPTPLAYRINGAYKAIEGTGARLLSPWSAEQYVEVGDFQKGELHRTQLGWQAVPSVLLRADVLIDLPVFKHHRAAGVSGALKKLMGCVWRRGSYHAVDLQGCIAELASILRPTLTVMDATTILSTNGPDGPGRLVPGRTVLASHDPVMADAYACRFLHVDPARVRHLTRAAALGVGSVAVDESRIQKLSSES